MPTRSYYFPKEFSHIEAILRSQDPNLSESAFRPFREANIPPLLSPMDIAIVLGIGPSVLQSIIFKPERHYRNFTLKKRDGTLREISTPRTYLKVIQWWILDNILNNIPVSNDAFGFIKGRNINQNARHHLGSTHFLTVDIRSFFDSSTQDQVFNIFLKLGYIESVSIALSRLCCRNESLPQGAPTSPALGNQILKPLDEILKSICNTNGMKYSRYADDITVSSRKRISSNFILAIDSEVKKIGFQLKSEKTRFAGPGDRTSVTGLVVREFVQPPRSWRKYHRSALHHLTIKSHLEKADRDYLLGISGYSAEFPDSVDMQRLRQAALALLTKEAQSS